MVKSQAGPRTEEAVIHSLDCPMLVRALGSGSFVRTNPAFSEKTGFSAEELKAQPFYHWITPQDQQGLQAAIASGDCDCYQTKHITKDGDDFPITVQVSYTGDTPVVLARCSKATQAATHENIEIDEITVSGTLDTIARIIEEQNPGYKCSILLVADGKFVSGAGPSLPDDYNAAIDGFAIGPTVGSCGTAIYWNVPVIAEDILNDPLWEPFHELTKEAGVAACWSHPFTSRQGAVLGALAFYAPEPRKPTPEQLSNLKAAAQMTGLAVERGRAEEALREKRKRELELEEQLLQAAKMEALGVMAGGIAHDFNNIMATISGSAELALMRLDTGDDVKSILKDIINASERAGNFCNQMLAYAGQTSIASSKVDLSDLLFSVSNLVQSAIPKKANLVYDLHPDPVYIAGDENQLTQVLMNLITNAAESLGEGAGTITVESTIEYYEQDQLEKVSAGTKLKSGDYLRLNVIDTGCGMDQATASRIFDPFFTTKFTGRGLGLAAVRGIVNKHEGAIWLESRPGDGTTFTLLLPTVVAPPAKETAAPVATKPTQRKRVLVVDDETKLRKVFCQLLEHGGFDILEAGDGQEAIETYTNKKEMIDCVLLDLNMPKLGGEEVYRELRKQDREVPIVLMSGFSEQEVMDRFEGASISAALQKPVRANDLIAGIRWALGAEA